MIKNKAIEVIRTFSAKEMKSFELYINSQFHNSNKALPELYKHIKRYMEKPPKNEINEEFLYNNLYPGKVYNYGIMKNLMSDLLKMAEKFLIEISSSNQREFEDRLKLLDEYNKRSLDKFFHSEYTRLERSLEYSIVNSLYYRNKIRLVERLHEFFAKRSLYQREAETQYPLSIFFSCNIISMLKQGMAGMDYLSYQINFVPELNIIKSLYNSLDLKKFLENINELEPAHFDHITLEIMLMLLYTEPDNDENYFALKKIVASTITKYSNPDKWHLTQSLINFLLNAYVKGKHEYFKEIADVRKIQIENMKFNTDGMGPLQNGVYRNIAEAFIILGDLEFAENFIKNWIIEIEEDKRQSTFSYCMALVEEARGNNEKVLEYIMNVEQSDYQTKFSSKMLGLIAFYNLNLFEQGLNAVDSFKHFIKDAAEFSEAMKKNFSERVRLMEKLFKIKANPEKYSISDLNTLTEATEIFNPNRKEWFLQKIEELKMII